MHTYCIFLICIFAHISCMFGYKKFGTAYFVYISAYFNLNVMAYLPLCILKLISAYLHLLCPPRPIKLINIQTAAGAQRKHYFFRLPNFLSFNCPHTRLKITVRRLAYNGSAEGEPKLHLLLTSVCQRQDPTTLLCLFSSCNLDNWYLEHAPRLT